MLQVLRRGVSGSPPFGYRPAVRYSPTRQTPHPKLDLERRLRSAGLHDAAQREHLIRLLASHLREVVREHCAGYEGFGADAVVVEPKMSWLADVLDPPSDRGAVSAVAAPAGTVPMAVPLLVAPVGGPPGE